MPGLQDVATSAAAALGVAGFADTLGLGPQERVVIVLLDGLGWQLLDAHRDLAPFLTAQQMAPAATVFPSSTGPALGALGTGLLPGAHGLVASLFVLPETGQVLNPLQWPEHATGPSSPLAVQPEPTVFERVARAGVQVTSVGPKEYEQSGLTRAVLRGADYAAAETAAQRVRAAGEASAHTPSLTYVYWRDVDRTGHANGVDSGQWREALRQADFLCERLAAAVPDDTLLLVTADHGMVDCPPSARVHIESDPSLRAGVRVVAGEPRVRQLYLDDAADADDVVARWRDRLGDRAQVLTRADVVAAGLTVPVDDEVAERMGDVVVIAHADLSIASDVDKQTSELIGQHGGLTDAETAIPVVTVTT